LWNTDYKWSKHEEWSEPWGGVEAQWYGSILPRIQAFVPAGRILEIAPGFGRWTQFLKDLCDDLTVVDLSPTCIEHCQERFATSTNISYFANDGKSLDMIPDGSIDFVYTYDSLVHAELDVLEAYLHELKKKLSPEGVGFFHHSNIGEHETYHRYQRKLPEGFRQALLSRGILNRRHLRSFSVTAEKFAVVAEAAGLPCRSQEMINWRQRLLTDCFSVFSHKGSHWDRPNRVVRNTFFNQETEELARRAPLYYRT